MKASELRIGNLVYGYKTVWDVDSTDFCNIGVIETYKPIPLTEEWLLKFGFELQPKKNDLNSWYYIEKGKFSMNNARGFWSHSPIYLEDVVEIKYVHQLQNLYYALTGEELEIINT